MKIHTQSFNTPYGELLLGSLGNKLCLCDWKYRKKRDSIDQRLQKALKTECSEDNSPVIEETKKQLTEYFERKREVFDISLLFAGTNFQKTVWNALLEIPFGNTETYLSLSKNLGNEKAIRAVATANGANALSILVPCHRIIGSDGHLVGYAGGLEVKKKLLQLENALPTSQLSLF